MDDWQDKVISASLDFIRRHAELTDDSLSNPNALPISLCLCPPSHKLKYIAIVRASFSIPLRRCCKSSTRFAVLPRRITDLGDAID